MLDEDRPSLPMGLVSLIQQEGTADQARYSLQAKVG
jgi:hypothetical protein